MNLLKQFLARVFIDFCPAGFRKKFSAIFVAFSSKTLTTGSRNIFHSPAAAIRKN
jgi:hypothetical protein